MSSLLFSPTCLNPLQGLIDYSKEVKPFHTKILETRVAFSFEDKVEGKITESLTKLIEQRFDLSRGICYPEQIACDDQGFEVEPFDSELGFEPTLIYSITEEVTQYPTGTFSAAGSPLYYLFDICVEETSDDPQQINRQHNESFVFNIYAERPGDPVRFALQYPSYIEDGDYVAFTTVKYNISSPIALFADQISNQRLFVARKVISDVDDIELSNVPPDSRSPIEMANSWMNTTFEMYDPSIGDLLRTPVAINNHIHFNSGDLRLKRVRWDNECIGGYAETNLFEVPRADECYENPTQCRTGYESTRYETNLYESSEIECESTCNGTYTFGQRVLNIYNPDDIVTETQQCFGGFATGGFSAAGFGSPTVVQYDITTIAIEGRLPVIGQRVMQRFVRPFVWNGSQWERDQSDIVYLARTAAARNNLAHIGVMNVGDQVALQTSITPYSFLPTTNVQVRYLATSRLINPGTISVTPLFELVVDSDNPEIAIPLIIVNTIDEMNNIPPDFQDRRVILFSDLHRFYVYSNSEIECAGNIIEYTTWESYTDPQFASRQQALLPTEISTSIDETLEIEDIESGIVPIFFQSQTNPVA